MANLVAPAVIRTVLQDYGITSSSDLTNTAEGANSDAMGIGNKVYSSFSFAAGAVNSIGDENDPVSGLAAFTSGCGNNIKGAGSAAVGLGNIVNGRNSVALAYFNNVYSDASTALGYGNTVGTEGQTGNTSQASIATGYYNTVTGTASFAANGRNIVAGDYAAAFGMNNTVVTGERAFVAGEENNVTGKRAVAFGKGNTASAEDAIAFGNNTKALNRYTATFGLNSEAHAECSAAFGNHNVVSGYAGFAVGQDNTISAQKSFAAGGSNTISAGYSAAVGNGNTITKTNCFASGYKTKLYADYSFGANYNNTIESGGAYSSVFGYENTIEASHSFIAGGSYNKIVGGGGYSFASGYNNQIDTTNNDGNNGASVAFGRYGKITKWGCATFGNSNHATTRNFKFVCGEYNAENASALFEVGNGDGSNSRSNAFEVYKDGGARFYGRLNIDEAPIHLNDALRLTDLEDNVITSRIPTTRALPMGSENAMLNISTRIQSSYSSCILFNGIKGVYIKEYNDTGNGGAAYFGLDGDLILRGNIYDGVNEAWVQNDGGKIAVHNYASGGNIEEQFNSVWTKINSMHFYDSNGALISW